MACCLVFCRTVIYPWFHHKMGPEGGDVWGIYQHINGIRIWGRNNLISSNSFFKWLTLVWGGQLFVIHFCTRVAMHLPSCMSSKFMQVLYSDSLLYLCICLPVWVVNSCEPDSSMTAYICNTIYMSILNHASTWQSYLMTRLMTTSSCHLAKEIHIIDQTIESL